MSHASTGPYLTSLPRLSSTSSPEKLANGAASSTSSRSSNRSRSGAAGALRSCFAGQPHSMHIQHRHPHLQHELEGAHVTTVTDLEDGADGGWTEEEPRRPLHRGSNVNIRHSNQAAEQLELPVIGATAKRTQGPIAVRWNKLPCLLLVLFILAAAYYLYVRLTTLTSVYACFIVGCELLGLSSFVPYAILLTRGVFPTGSPGLPPSEEQVAADAADIRFSVHILIPCYKEPLEVVSATVLAALEAQLPAHTRRTVYLLDDGNSVEKRLFIQSLGAVAVQYISGRERKAGQVNGKSENLNNALRGHIFASCPTTDSGETDWTQLPANELIVVFDADMRARPDFFLKTLEVMSDDQLQLVLTPQAFHNISTDSDLFNNVNKQFWEYWLPGAFAYGYIACTGTNFVIRARALASCGWFPNTTITEDYALGMELKKRGYQATYLQQYLAEGEAPEDVRNIFQQRSRWTKGHYQVFFSRANPLLVSGLPLFQRLWYCYAAWAPFCNTLTTPVFILVPFISIFFGYHPVSISFQYVLAATLYFSSTLAIQYYVHTFAHLKSMWFVNVSNTVLFFTQWKALMNSFMASVGAKDLTFKVTTKNKTQAQDGAEGQQLHPKFLQKQAVQPSDDSWADVDVPCGRGRALSQIKTREEGKALLADAEGHEDTTPCYSATHSNDRGADQHSKYPHQRLSRRSSPRHPAYTALATPTKGTPTKGSPTKALSILPTPRSLETPRERRQRRIRTVLASFKPKNIRDIGAMADPLVMLIIFLLSVATGCVGIWQMSGSFPGASRFSFSSINGSPFLIIATMWAFHNAVAPLLFMHYCWTTGESFKFMVRWLSFFSTIIAIGSTIFLWMLIPITVVPSDALGLAINSLYPNAIARDTNTNWSFVVGLNQLPVEVPFTNVNLTGGLLTSDHAKYGMPLAYSLTMLSWAMIKYPKAFVGRELPLLGSLREGADYLMRCDLNPGSSDNPMFVAQVGDGAPYQLVEDSGFDPILSGKVWTSPQEDPMLVGNSSRTVWLMTRDHVGADLLADAAAALAAVGKVFQLRDPAFSARAILKARQLYRFATRNDLKPRSYCEYVPCTTNISVIKSVIVRKVDLPNATNSSLSLPDTCYYLDWITRTCRIGASLEACIAETKLSNNVYTNRLDCCNVLFQLDPTNTKAQGICAVPDDQWYCYVPVEAQRTCIKQTIDPTTGEGCTGKSLTVFTSALSCCENLGVSGVISPSTGMAGTGICSANGMSGNASTTCWIPSMTEGTCVESNGSACSAYGVESSFDTTIGCCNRLVGLINDNIKLLGGQQSILTGVCARKPLPPLPPLPPPPSPPPPPPPLPPNKTSARALLGSSSSSNVTLNGSVWKLPDYLKASTACADGTCTLIQINTTKTIPIYNSSSVLDDLAWGASWLYWATGDPTYLGQAERYLGRHYKEDLKEDTLQRDRSYYVPNWNNVAWASNVLLANLSGGAAEYMDRINPFLKAWITGDPVDTTFKNGTQHDLVLPRTVLENITDPASGEVYFLIPDCIATATWEVDCTDGVDNDCNGLIDREDPACGLFPVLYTSQNLPLSSAPALPNAANTAFLAMLYSDVFTPASSVLRCWGLGQATYMLGGTQTVDSAVVGYGPNPPTIVQQRASSCPRTPKAGPNSTALPVIPCTWNSGFYPNIPNPALDLVAGALVWGPSDGTDTPSKLRQRDDSRVRLEDNVGLTGLLAGLADKELKVESCFLGHGIWQKYIWPSNPL